MTVIKTMIAATTLAFALMLMSGCTRPMAAREYSQLVSSYVDTVRVETKRFHEARDDIAAARQRGINSLESLAAEAEAKRDARLAAMRLTKSNRDRASLFESIIQDSEEQQARVTQLRGLAEKHADRLAKTRSSIAIRSKKLSEAARKLAELGAKPSL